MLVEFCYVVNLSNSFYCLFFILLELYYFICCVFLWGEGRVELVMSWPVLFLVIFCFLCICEHGDEHVEVLTAALLKD